MNPSDTPIMYALQTLYHAYNAAQMRPPKITLEIRDYDRLLAEYRLIDPSPKELWAPVQMFGMEIEKGRR